MAKLEQDKLKDILKKYTYRANEPRYKVGDKVHTSMFGCLGGIVLEIIENTFYKIDFKYSYLSPLSKKVITITDTRWFIEFELSNYNREKTEFTRKLNWKDSLHFITNKKILRSFHFMELEGYLNLFPEYQRELIWSEEQKIELIDSIFNMKNIGSIVLLCNEDYEYEVLDGKQRLSTIFDYMKDRFKYKNVYYSELSLSDRETFESTFLSYTQIELSRGSMSTEQKIELFIDFNTKGTSVSEEHIKSIKNKFIK